MNVVVIVATVVTVAFSVRFMRRQRLVSVARRGRVDGVGLSGTAAGAARGRS